ncbi:MAG: hypothetical protein ICV83_22270, partial [Cytophagales bacterium]|nr:hypothetical protein [Cytophagales bacterium]
MAHPGSVHHRVKSNLQVVMSLLNSLADKAALSAIRQSRHPVQAMALIHPKLYRAEGLTPIAMPDYVK